MFHRPEYHKDVRHSFSASLLLASLILMPLAFRSPAQAQIHGTPPSVTSPGFGGHPINGVPPSVTSLGPNGYGFGYGFRGTYPSPYPFRNGTVHRRHHRDEGYIPALTYAVPVPYAVDNGPADDQADDDDSNYQGGPTVFDRRGSGANSYIPGVRDVSPAHSMQSSNDDPPSDPPAAQEPTVLVFKDGHKLELGNYAIVGSTLFDLTPGHPRKIALADLDLEATRKANDDRGVVFDLPPSLQSN
jgi:hypothetical protein